MKTIKLLILILILSFNSVVYGQFFQKRDASFDLTGALGVSAYYGDMVEKASFFKELLPVRLPSFCGSAGVAYNYNHHLSIRGDFSFMQIQGSDSKSLQADLRARNLSFKSKLWDLNASIEYSVIDIVTKRHKFTPYALIGIGLCHFNPYTTDRNGKKVFLQPLGTEGQGLSAYPDRTPYSTTVLQFPVGIGIKYVINEKLILAVEDNHRYVNSDYLDDLSGSSYPDKALLAAKDPGLPQLTYRGDELPGGAPYPTGVNAKRGSPNNKDSYDSWVIRIIYRIKH